VAGCPGACRRQTSWDTLDVPGAIKLTVGHHIREDEFVCQLDPAFVDRDVADSGDLAEETLVVPPLYGILKQEFFSAALQ
jgi:hypothetical protein